MTAKRILYVGNKLSGHGLTPGVIETLGAQLEKAGYRVKYAGSFRNRVLRFLEMIFKTLTSGVRSDYILIDTYSTGAFWYAYATGMVARLTGTSYIPILHGGSLPERLKKSPGYCKALFGHAYMNVAVSGYLESVFSKAGFKTITIPNSINISDYCFRHRLSLQPKLLWVRSFSSIYNPKMAVDVLALLSVRHPDAGLCMVGPDKDGSLSGFESYAAARGVRDRIRITGRLDKKTWTDLAGQYDFFINTTNVDNTPVSIIEAMALGLQVVSTNPGGIPWLLDNGKEAVLVNPGDAEKMTEAILNLMAYPEASAAMTLAARKKAEDFDDSHVINLWSGLLK